MDLVAVVEAFTTAVVVTTMVVGAYLAGMVVGRVVLGHLGFGPWPSCVRATASAVALVLLGGGVVWVALLHREHSSTWAVISTLAVGLAGASIVAAVATWRHHRHEEAS